MDNNVANANWSSVYASLDDQGFAGLESVLTARECTAIVDLALTPSLGDAVIFSTNFRPVKGARGYYRARMKHGVSTVSQGQRYTMGIIFHDAN